MYQRKLIDVIINVPVDDTNQESVDRGIIEGAMRLN